MKEYKKNPERIGQLISYLLTCGASAKSSSGDSKV
jgi:hypothetical protein